VAPLPEGVGGQLVQRSRHRGDRGHRLGQPLALVGRGGARILLRQREDDDLQVIVDPVAEQRLDLGDQPLTDRRCPPPQHPEERPLDHARHQGGPGELLRVGAELERKRYDQHHGEGNRDQIQLDVGGDVRLESSPARALPERKAPPRVGRRSRRGRRVAGQADLSLTSTLSLKRPVTGSLFCFWYARSALRVSVFMIPLALPL